jgi:hypothetical protein
MMTKSRKTFRVWCYTGSRIFPVAFRVNSSTMTPCFWTAPQEQEKVASASLRVGGSTSRKPADEIGFFIGKDANATSFLGRPNVYLQTDVGIMR